MALFGILIAWLQWRINHNRLKLERFEDRFARFEATRKFLQTIIYQGDVVEKERLAFLSSTVGNRFVFDNKIADFLDELHGKAIDLETGNAESRHGPQGRVLTKRRSFQISNTGSSMNSVVWRSASSSTFDQNEANKTLERGRKIQRRFRKP